MKCFYHNADLDGKCSGAIVKMRYPECELIGINYGDEFPWNRIAPDEVVFMVDFSLQPFEQMEKLVNSCKLIWIDHHQSAIEEAKKNEIVRAAGLLVEGKGACEIVWSLLFTDEEMPLFVKLLAEYDVWDHSDPRTLPFQYGMRLYDTDPENQGFWENLTYEGRLACGSVAMIINQGQTILDYEKQQNRVYVNACAFETQLDALRCVAVNKMLTNSKLFDSIWDDTKYDAMLAFGWRNGSWTVSLYSDKADIDVSVVAKNNGGGGHKGAAGFQCSELPFKLGGKNV